MANSYYTRTNGFAAGTKAKGEHVRTELDNVVVGFDLLPTPGQFESGSLNYITPGGTADAITLAAPQGAWTTYTGKDGYEFTLQIVTTNGGPLTVNVDGLGAVQLKRSDAAALQAGDLTAKMFIDIVYDESAGFFYVKQSVASFISDQAANAPAASETGIVKATGAAFEGTVSDGDAVYWDAGNNRYAKAISDGTTRQNAVGIADVTSAKVELSGVMSALMTGLNPGDYYYLSPTVAGQITTLFSVTKMGVARTTTALFIDIGAAAAPSSFNSTPDASIAASHTLVSSSSRAQIVDGATTDISITLPDATELPKAMSFFTISNLSGHTVAILNDSGATVGGIAANQSESVHLVDNSTADGVWQTASKRVAVRGVDVITSSVSGSVSSGVSVKLNNDLSLVCFDEVGGRAFAVDTSTGIPASGSDVQFEAGGILGLNVIRLTDTKALAVYTDLGNSNHGTACVLDIVGTIVTAGTPFVFEAASTLEIGAGGLTSSTVLVSWKEVTSVDLATIVLSVSGTTITAGTKDTMTAAVATTQTAVAVLSSTKVCIFYKDVSYKGVVHAISGTTITAGTAASLIAAVSTGDLMAEPLGSDAAIITFNDVVFTAIESGGALSLGSYRRMPLGSSDNFGQSLVVISGTRVVRLHRTAEGIISIVLITVEEGLVSYETPQLIMTGDNTTNGLSTINSLDGGAILLSHDTDNGIESSTMRINT